ncbi:MAG: RNA polymerase sigma factor [Anaerolineales bacterium]|nr:RNA polymerase sigma factor [Anaerolineales bacterium]
MGIGQRDNEGWLSDLRAVGDVQAAALSDLRQVVLNGLPYALSAHLPASHPEYEALVEEVAQETLLRVLDRLDSFEGRSQFTTWVHKIAIRLAFSELRRRRWKDVSLDEGMQDEDAPSIPEPADPQASPEILTERSDLMVRIQQVIKEELSDRQRIALQAVAIQGMPMEEVARRMGMQRNALYKLLHDARKRLKLRMEAMDLTAEAMMATFDQNAR